MLKPRRAAVRPRVIAPVSGEPLLLEDLILERLWRPNGALIAIVGPRGWGKTTALEHLAAVLPARAKADLQDDPDEAAVEAPTLDRLAIYASGVPMRRPHRAIYQLAPWGAGEMLEFLESRHAGRARPVLSRLMSDPDRARLGGCPELLSIVMDRMADDADIVDVRTALKREFAARAGEGEEGRLLLEACLRRGNGPWNPRGVSLLRHAWPRLLMAAEAVVRGLEEDAWLESGDYDWPEEVIEAIAEASARSPIAVSQLRYLVAHGCPDVQPACASILHAMKVGWAPQRWHVPSLAGATLRGAEWPRVNLSGADLEGADFTRANLSQASLIRARADRARFDGADLHDALLPEIAAVRAQLKVADLTAAVATEGDFSHAALDFACLMESQLGGASFFVSSLRGARFSGAKLMGAILVAADIQGADFRGADLEAASMRDVVLRDARWDGAKLSRADLSGADLEGLVANRVKFEGANLRDSTMSSSRLMNAVFRNACLRGARLADIEWPGANLFYADLRAVSFQQGTSRCGLVFSTTPCEGSRTGYYTDDFADRERAPEEIRKANLCGADLRGARLEGTDLYLVDLRGARLSAELESYARKCGAILGENRVA